MPEDVKQEYEGLLSFGASQQSALRSLLADAGQLAEDALQGHELFASQEAKIAWGTQFLEDLVNLAMPITQGHQIPVHW